MTPDMTCQELHSFFKDHLIEANLRFERGEAMKHIAACADCRRFVEEQKELAKGLQLVRESVSPIPESLDATVLASYRKHFAERGRNDLAIVHRLRPALVLHWGAIAAATLAVAALLFYARKPVVVGTAPKTEQPIASLPPAQVVSKNVPIAEKQPTRPVSTVTKQMRAPRPLDRPAISSARVENPIPKEFRSLMYCDELSCAGAMDMIRVQLPSAMVARPVGWTQTSSVVNADVLVGPDGIARGIRIVE
jgi:hypothetical protein